MPMPTPGVDPSRLRTFGDIPETRRLIYANTLEAAKAIPAVSNTRFSLAVENPDYDGPEEFSPEQEKRAVLENRTLSRRLQADYVMRDHTGKEVDRRRMTIAHVPHLTNLGTFVYHGNAYPLINQLRLRSGVFARVKDNGEIESHVNVAKGRAHRLSLDPETGVFRINIAQSHIPLMPLLQSLGATKKDVEDAWGPEIAAANYGKNDAKVMDKLYARILGPNAAPAADNLAKTAAVVKAYQEMTLDPEVTSRTLGKPFKNLSADVLLAATKKLIQLHRGEAAPDDRDAPAFQRVLGPEDFFAEKFGLAGGVLRKALWKAAAHGSLAKAQPGGFTDLLNSVLTDSGLASAAEEVNPAELFDYQSRVTRMGKGGIPSTTAIPAEARAVQPTYLGYIDPVRTPECYAADTEVMTRTGWKTWPTVTVSDELACLVDGRLEYHRPTSVYAYAYRGMMYGAKSGSEKKTADGRINYLVTPDHRIWSRPHHTGAEYRFETAADVWQKARRVLSGGFLPYDGDAVTVFTLPTVENDYNPKQVAKSNSVRTHDPVAIADWAELLGWYLGEGSTTFVSGGGDTRIAYLVRISQCEKANPTNYARLRALLSRLPFNWCHDTGNRGFCIGGKQLANYFRQFGGSADRFIPEELQRSPATARRRLLEALLLAEGRRTHRRQKGIWDTGRTQFCTTSRRLADDVARLAFSLGVASRIVFEKDDRPQARYGGAWVVHLHVTNEHQIIDKPDYGRRDHYRCEYDGIVYCATVPGGLLYVKRGDSVGHWSGNSERTGVDLRFARAARKGPNGQIYTPVRDAKTGQLSYKSPQELAESVLGFPGHTDPDEPVPVIKGGRMDMVPKEEVTHYVPEFEDTFSPLGNLIPLKSMLKGQRAVMAARMMTQALPLQDAEAPFVRSATPEDANQSFEEIYSKHMGAVRAPQAARVVAVAPDKITLADKDGKRTDYPLYRNFPYNRKTALDQTPVVKAGDVVQPNQLLATSNFTDKDGALALGRNLRVGYLPYAGSNYEDAYIISESAAKKLTSHNMYQHSREWDDQSRQGKQTFTGIFPSKYDKDTLANFTDDGVIKPGTKVKFGDPLVLAVRERDMNKKSLLGGRTAFVDDSETWEHHSPGEVTDVAVTPKGVNVVVKASSPMQEADKIAGRMGDKGIIAKIIPDSDMPQDSQGRPFEVLANPLGIISRVNPNQIVEAALGKIAERTGKPYKLQDFKDAKEMVEFALEELRKNNMSDLEDVTDPRTGRKIPGVFTGNRWFMKLHHTADAKEQGRGIGSGYSAEGIPAKGGPQGSKRIGMLELSSLLSGGACFMGGVNVLTENGSMEISRIVKQRERVRVACADPTTGRVEYQPVTDWFCRCAAPGELLRIETFARTGEDGERGSHRAIRCTRNHEFYTPTGKIPAASLKVGDTVLTPGTRVLAWQEQLLLGGLMGDTYMALRATAATGASGWTVVHGHKQRTYLDWKFSLLRNLGVGEPRTQKLGKGGFAKQPTSRFTLRAHAVTSKMCLDFYAGGTKEPPPGIVQRMGWYGLGIWFGDDGSCVCPKASNKISSLRFHTCAFSRESVERLRDELIAFTGLPWLCRLQNGRYPILVLGNGDGTQNNKGTDNIRRFSDMLAPYLPPMLGYKLRRNDCGSAWAGLTPPQGTWLEPTQIKSIAEYTPAPHEDYLVYDITVENRHNYVVHGVLVSNSQILRDARMIRGQARPEYWARYMAGDAPPVPTVSATHQKFMNMLRAAGINPVNEGTQTHLMAMTDKDIDALAGERNLENAETVDWADMAPIKGGLFDQKLTGGHASSKDGGNTWSAIKLHEPYPSPVMEEPIRKILGLTEPKFLAILSGKEDLNGKRGPAAIGDALDKIDVQQAIGQARADIASGKKTKRDAAIRRLGYLRDTERLGIHPRDWMLKRVPVLPPAFRPVSTMGAKKLPLVDDANFLYKEIFDANKNLADLSAVSDDVSEERAALYNAFKAVVGLGDPTHPKNQERQVKGILRHVFNHSPKSSIVHRKLLGSQVDRVGRATIAPDPSLDMDSVGLPANAAWAIYQPDVVRRLVRTGMAGQEAIRAVENRSPAARQALTEELEEGVVLYNRAPTLHRYGVMAAKPRLTTGHALKISPLVVGGFSCIGRVPIIQDGVFRIVDLADFPRGDRVPDEENAFYVPDGVLVLSHTPGGFSWSHPDRYYVHPGLPAVEVTFGRARKATVSADQSVYCFDPERGECRRYRPQDAIGLFSPRVDRVCDIATTPVTAITGPAGDPIKLDRDFGWWLGVVIGDGWVSKTREMIKGVCLSGQKLSAILPTWVDIGHRLFGVLPGKPVDRDNVKQAWGRARKLTISSTSFGKWLLPLIGSRAANKRVPDFVMRGPAEFRAAVLAGLMDTDGTAGVSKTGRRNIAITTKSQNVADAAVWLFLSLGVDALAAPRVNAHGRAYFGITPSIVDLATTSIVHELRHTQKAEAFTTLLTDHPVDKFAFDSVPITPAEAEAVWSQFRGTPATARKNRDAVAFAEYAACKKSQKAGCIGRFILGRIIARLGRDNIPPSLLLRFAGNERWERLSALSVKPACDMYDLRVPGGTLTFVIANKLTMFDSADFDGDAMQFHAITDPDARKEALEKLLPSRNLFSVARLDRAHYLPSQEYVGGLYETSARIEKDKPPVTFATIKDALAARAAGEIGVGRRVRILYPDK
jgi:DNA-directed RNA polymerase beta subunit/DNA-directed RNA polymerase beta' subunit